MPRHRTWARSSVPAGMQGASSAADDPDLASGGSTKTRSSAGKVGLLDSADCTRPARLVRPRSRASSREIAGRHAESADPPSAGPTESAQRSHFGDELINRQASVTASDKIVIRYGSERSERVTPPLTAKRPQPKWQSASSARPSRIRVPKRHNPRRGLVEFDRISARSTQIGLHIRFPFALSGRGRFGRSLKLDRSHARPGNGGAIQRHHGSS